MDVSTRLIHADEPHRPPHALTPPIAQPTNAAMTLCDNTFATPINQHPLEHGVDLVWHSATKYLGGHADLMAGALLGDEATIERLWHTAQMAGAVLSPFNAWL